MSASVPLLPCFKVDPASEGAVPVLVEALDDEDSSVRKDAAIALGQIGPASKGAVPVLIGTLKDDDADVREAAVYTLGRIGPAAKEAVPALIETLKDEDIYVRLYTAGALGQIGHAAKDAVPALREALKDPEDRVSSVRRKGSGEHQQVKDESPATEARVGTAPSLAEAAFKSSVRA